MTDNDGYPTKSELKRIERWGIRNDSDCLKLLEFVETLWHWPNFFRSENNVFTLVTGGWSGNESLISAMHRNTMFWLVFWKSSERGGRHVFCSLRTEASSG